MASKFNYIFIEEPSDKLKCSICLDVAEDPKQHEKCGKVFCSKCIEKNGTKPCPSCRGKSPNYFTDMRGAQEIRDLRINCCNLDNGCKWQGSVGTLEKHLATCEFDFVTCKYSYVGCDVKMRRRDIKQHEENDNIHHLQLALQSTAIPTLSRGERFIFKMTEYSTKKQNKEVFISDPFYTHSNGYKMCLKIYAGGKGSGEGTHLSVSSCLLRGPFDKSLQWPFSGIVLFAVLDQTCDNFFFTRFVYDGERKKHGLPGESIDDDNFILHSTLSTTYLKDDSVYFQVGVIFSDTLPWLECGKQFHSSFRKLTNTYVHKDPLVFKLDTFADLKSACLSFISQNFFTHPDGYRMSVRVYPGGNGEAKGKYISVFVNMKGGPHDANLSWPFLGTIKLELLNQLSDKDHHVANISITREDDMRVEKSLGYPKFIKYSDLQCGEKQYLMDDTLYFRVSVTVDNHKPWLTCTA